jgi:hypothetical protein
MTDWQKRDAKDMLAYCQRRLAAAKRRQANPLSRYDEEAAPDDIAHYKRLIAQLEAGLGVRQ